MHDLPLWRPGLACKWLTLLTYSFVNCELCRSLWVLLRASFFASDDLVLHFAHKGNLLSQDTRRSAYLPAKTDSGAALWRRGCSLMLWSEQMWSSLFLTDDRVLVLVSLAASRLRAELQVCATSAHLDHAIRSKWVKRTIKNDCLSDSSFKLIYY